MGRCFCDSLAAVTLARNLVRPVYVGTVLGLHLAGYNERKLERLEAHR